MKFLRFCALAHVHISSVLLPLLQRTINLSIYLSTTHFLKRKSQHWFKSKYAAETRETSSQTNVLTIQKLGQALLITVHSYIV